jgi:hypothetical protein
MIVQYVKFESALTETEVVATAKERLPQFQASYGRFWVTRLIRRRVDSTSR